MVPSILHRVIQNPTISLSSSDISTSPAVLSKFRRHRVRHADYPAILPSDDDAACVRGTLVHGLSDGDIARLDRFEGAEYERSVVEVQVLKEAHGKGQAITSSSSARDGGYENSVAEEGEDTTVKAETYVWIAGEYQLEDGEWDFDEFRKEKLWRWLGSDSNEYQDVDGGDESGKVDPTRGRGRTGASGKH